MRKRWIWITAICAGFVLVATLLGVIIFQLNHKHTYSDVKVYHIYNDHIYYTSRCTKDKHSQKFETDATFAEVLASLSNNDRVVIEENIVTPEIFKINSVLPQSSGQKVDVVINIELNNKSVCSMFELNASYGDIKFNISNGTINSSYSNAIKVSGMYGNVELNILNVDCMASGAKNAPLYIENTHNITVKASDSKFISQNQSLADLDYGVGAFINNLGDFKFENCLFEGGDGLHIKQGTVSLKNCDLVNTGLINQAHQSVNVGFSAVGASLAAHCYTSGAGTTNFEITIENCEMTTNNSNRVMYIYNVAKSGYQPSINPNSYVKIKSCRFNQDPDFFDNLDKVIYEGDFDMEIDSQGRWVYGDVTK